MKITMSQLGNAFRFGRFGNQILQYIFLKATATVSETTDIETGDWIGQLYFINIEKKKVINSLQNIVSECDIVKKVESDTDFQGFFQIHTSNYMEYKDRIIHEWLVFNPSLTTNLTLPIDTVGVHIRHGDYGNSPFLIAPIKWYIDWLQYIGAKHIFLASDDLDRIIEFFHEFTVTTRKDFNGDNLFIDFYLLSKCKKIAISNSTFSFTASLLCTDLEMSVRPSFTENKLIEYNPWSSIPFM